MLSRRILATLLTIALTACDSEPIERTDFDPPVDTDAAVEPLPMTPECVTADDCYVPPCMVPACVEGACMAAPVADGAQCQPTILPDVVGTCEAGVCTTDYCKTCDAPPCMVAFCQVGACALAPMPNGTACETSEGQLGACGGGTCHGAP